jgi:hypothetical protein
MQSVHTAGIFDAVRALTTDDDYVVVCSYGAASHQYTDNTGKQARWCLKYFNHRRVPPTILFDNRITTNTAKLRNTIRGQVLQFSIAQLLPVIDATFKT